MEWESRRAFQKAMEQLRDRDEQFRAQFLRTAHVRVYRPLEIVRVHRREPKAVGVGLVRVKAGSEDEFARVMREQLHRRLRDRPGLLATGVYQGEDEPHQFLIRNAWDSEQDMLAHRAWMTREVLPVTDPHVARRELLDLLMRWHYRQTPLASPEAV